MTKEKPETEKQPPIQNNSKLLSFLIEDAVFAINIMSVREIRGWSPATTLPHAPQFVQGVMNLRGVVLPVIDLAQRLGMQRENYTERDVIIVVENEENTFGLRVSAVSDILSINSAEIQTPPEFADHNIHETVLGLFLVGDELVRILDLETMLPKPGTIAA
ncbi:MAG: chemotaxis protein CheW [Boseongicola sp.]|nr:chemotaxis protein CheW [Boseongicola sp.]